MKNKSKSSIGKITFSSGGKSVTFDSLEDFAKATKKLIEDSKPPKKEPRP